jgi:hypothetical protein
MKLVKESVDITIFYIVVKQLDQATDLAETR